MVLIDTHIAVFLHGGHLDKLSASACEQLELNDIVLPEMARLELQYLYEIKRIAYRPEQIVADLYADIGLYCSPSSMAAVVQAAIGIDWTRDAFDRLIAADSLCSNVPLITRDKTIIAHLPNVICAR